MTIIDGMTAKTATAKKPTAKKPKPGDWIAQAEVSERKDDGRLKPMTKNDERTLPPGSTFQFREVAGSGVVMAARIPSRSRGFQFAIPPTLARQVKKATAGLNWSTAFMALCDYALERLEAEPGKLTIIPDEDSAGQGRLACSFEFEPGRRLTTHLNGTMPGWPKDKSDRTRVGVPEDVRARVEKHLVTGSFGGTVMALAQWALIDLKARKKQLVVTPAGQE